MTAVLPDSPRPRRILCVDDEPAVRDVIALYLRRCGYDVEIAADGLIALNILAKDPARFDAVITDNQMPNLTGIALVERLRANGYPGHIVFFSSTLPTQSAEQLARLRVDAVVEKGRPLADLMSALSRGLAAK
jgi:CheY-like chemotaxis protein